MERLCHLAVPGDDADLDFAAAEDATRATGVSVDAPATPGATAVDIQAGQGGEAGVMDAGKGSGCGAA